MLGKGPLPRPRPLFTAEADRWRSEAVGEGSTDKRGASWTAIHLVREWDATCAVHRSGCFLLHTATVTPFSSMPTQYIIPAGLLATTKFSTTRVRSLRMLFKSRP